MRCLYFPLKALLVVLAAGSLTLAVYAAPDVLERVASFSRHADRSTLLALTCAGQRVLAVGEHGTVIFSDNGGISWQQASVPVSVSLTNIRFVSLRHGWAVGHSGIILHTRDQGATWSKQLDGLQTAKLIWMATQQDSLTHHDESTQKRLQHAQQWMADGPDKPFFDVYFMDENQGFAIGAYGLLLRTHNGGNTWVSWQAHIHNPKGKHLYRIGAFNSTLYIVGEQGAFYRSADAGQTFVEIKTPYQGSYFGLLPLTKDHVLLYGLRGNAYWSDNAGQDWHKSETGTLASLSDGLILDDGTLVLTSQTGEVLRSTDHGRSFQPLPVNRPFPFSGVAQVRNGDLVVSGVRGVTRVSLSSARVTAP